MSTTTTIAAPTLDEAAEMFRLATTSATKWQFLDGVVSLAVSMPQYTQTEIVARIGDTALFKQMHGDHRDTANGVAGSTKNARSKLKSIRDELSVVKVWAPADRVDGVSFEAHKVLNRLGSDAGGKILAGLVKNMGGPGNVTKASVVARLKVADPDHKPQSNGKKKPADAAAGRWKDSIRLAAGNQAVTGGATPLDLGTIGLLTLADAINARLTVADLSVDAALAKAVRQIVDVFEAFDARSAAKAKAKAKAPAAPTAAAGRSGSSASSKRKPTTAVKTPVRAAVKTPTRPVLNVKVKP
ncbi:hypothetical protein [Ilumatobacter sp.]|uniref:hypothetical protein n=1 Tax=Ilumatobacter sp. TaxID=1967498 RepID=UPI003750660A